MFGKLKEERADVKAWIFFSAACAFAAACLLVVGLSGCVPNDAEIKSRIEDRKVSRKKDLLINYQEVTVETSVGSVCVLEGSDNLLTQWVTILHHGECGSKK